ncbi:MAG: T9SS type A sorting domain-containing protein, partial [Bacteroidales bacterium]|nr:T9SS type A sorting domain-containing protein [Bacteroidales bacterium]
TASIIIDNVSYTENGGDNLVQNFSFEEWLDIVPEPELIITAPTNNSSVYGSVLNVVFSTIDFEAGVDGKVKYTLNSNEAEYATESPISLTNLDLGAHTLVLELVDMVHNSLDPQVIETIEFNCLSEMEENLETFDNSNATGSYTDGSFLGNNNITWYYYHSRDEGDFPINGKGLMLRKGFNSKIVSEELSGGISSFSVKMRKAFTGQVDRAIELYINDELIETSEIFGNADNQADSTIHTFEVSNIDIEGNFTIMLKPHGDADANQQITIDNISWTNYEDTGEPKLTIISPTNNAVFNETNVDIVFSTTNFELGTDGKLKYTINNEDAVYVTESPISLTNLDYGTYSIVFELVDINENSLDPIVQENLNFNIEQVQPELDIINPTDNQTINGNSVNLVFEINNFELGVDGKLAVALDNEDVYYTISTDPIEFADLTYSSHTIRLELVDMDENSLDPAIEDIVNFTCNEVIPGGFETFDNCEATIHYENATFVGNGDIEWTYYHSRSEGEFPINGKGLMLRNAGESWIESGEIGGGISSFEMKMKKAFTGTKDRQLELYINGNLVGESAKFGEDGTDQNIYTFSLDNINVGGSFTMKIKNKGTSTDNAQIVIDDISWTQFATTDPYLVINSPSNGFVSYEPNLNVVFSVYNFELGTDGKIQYVLNEEAAQYTTESPIVLLDLEDGEYSLFVQLVDMDDNPLEPSVSSSINFTVNTSGPEITPIYNIQYSEVAPFESPYKDEIVTVQGIVTASFNPTPHAEGYFIQDAAGAWNGLYIFDINNTPEIGDLVRVTGKITEYYEMTEMTNISEYTVLSIGEPVPAPVLVSTAEAASEMYESVLVKVEKAECVSAQNNFGEWYVNDGSGQLMMKENGAFAFEEAVGTKYDIIGVMMYSYEEFKLQYRIPSDIVVSTGINTELSKNTTIYPNPAKDILNINSKDNLKSVKLIAIDGKIVLNQDINNTSTTLDISTLPAGVYFLNLENENEIAIKKLIIE